MGKKDIHVIIILLFLSGLLYAQGPDKRVVAEINKLLKESVNYTQKAERSTAYLDMAYGKARKAESLSDSILYFPGKIQSLLLYSKIYRERNEKDRGKQFANEAIKLAERNNDHAWKGEGLIELSKYDGWGRGLPQKVKKLELALASFRLKSSEKQLADLLALLADQHFNIGNYNASIADGKEALMLYRKIGGGNLQALYATLGISHTKSGQFEEGLRYSLLAAEEGDKKKDSSIDMMAIYNHIGLSAYYNKDFSLARKYHEKFLSLAIFHGKTEAIFFATDNIVNDLLKSGEIHKADKFLKEITSKYSPREREGKILVNVSFIKIYTAQDNFKKAEEYHDKLRQNLNMLENELRPAILLNINNTLLSLYFKTKKYRLAQAYLDKNKRIAYSGNDMPYKLQNLLWEFKLDSVNGDHFLAIQSLQKYNLLKDSLFDKDKASQISNLHVQYETQKKDMQILEKEKDIRLLSKEREIQRAKIRSDLAIKIVTLVSIILLLVIVGILYKGYSIKKKRSEQLNNQKEEIEEKNKSLERLIVEKEWLLKEVHHRVKNNLQIIMSLLYAQSESLPEGSTREAIMISQGRVQSMALMHQKLYRSENLSTVNMPIFVSEFIDYINEAFNVNGRICFATDIENIDLDVSKAVPIGLILNEAITNSVKYAYPEGRGTINISLHNVDNETFELSVQDQGCGFSNADDAFNRDTLGLTLMRGLTEELDGTFELKHHKGVLILIRFTYTYKKHS